MIPDPPEPDRGTPPGGETLAVPPPTQQAQTLTHGQTGGDVAQRAKQRRKARAKPPQTLAKPGKATKKRKTTRKSPKQGAATGGGRKKAKKGTGPRRKAKKAAGKPKRTKKGPGKKASKKRGRA